MEAQNHQNLEYLVLGVHGQNNRFLEDPLGYVLGKGGYKITRGDIPLDVVMHNLRYEMFQFPSESGPVNFFVSDDIPDKAGRNVAFQGDIEAISRIKDDLGLQYNKFRE